MPTQTRDQHFGDRLYLRCRPPHASWVFRFTSPAGRRREMGLGRAQILEDGSVEDREAAAARARARKAARLVVAGIDPIDHREQIKAAPLRAAQAKIAADRERERWTLARAARDYHERVIEPSRSAKHAAQWIASLENHVPPGLWSKPIGVVTEKQLVEAVSGIQADARARVKSHWLLETKKRIAGRLNGIFEDAVMLGRADANVAERLVAHITRRAPRAVVSHWRSLPYRDAPELARQVLSAQGIAADALLFTMLTAARTAETLGAEWSEFDLEGRLWSVPAGRMKGRRSHAVHLSADALRVLNRMKGLHDRFVFPSAASSSECLSNMAMLTVLERIGMRDRTTVHGLRATFSTWANETKAARPEVVEAALAHALHGQERPYNRAEYLEERSKLLDAWAAHLLPTST